MHWRELFMIVFGMLLVAIPLWAPEAFIILGLVGWSIAYLYAYASSIGNDLTNTIPWMVAENVSYWPHLLLIGLFGLIRGPLGSAAMLAVWGPLFTLPAFLVSIGLGTVNEYGWEGYVSDNYQAESCQVDWDAPADYRNKHPVYCVRDPNPGLDLPRLVTDEWGEVVG